MPYVSEKMKKWMMFIAGVQVVSVLIWLAQAVKLWPDSLWAVSWLIAFPGSVLGHWAADQMLWTRASHWTIGLVGLVLATLINLLIAFALGSLCKRVYAMSKSRH
jgi:hypothetical protein